MIPGVNFGIDSAKKQKMWAVQHRAKIRFYFFSPRNIPAPRLKNASLGIRNLEYLPEGPWSTIVSNSRCDCYEKRVGLATHRTIVQLPSTIQGATHPASTL